MAKRRSSSRKSSNCPEPLNTLIDLAGAAALGAIVKSQVKRDYARGQGEASAKAAAAVFGAGSFRKGSAGIVNLGGLMGLNSALKDVERRQSYSQHTTRQTASPTAPPSSKPSVTQTVRKNLWREHCEDGSEYGIDPNDFELPDDYEEALTAAKAKHTCAASESESQDVSLQVVQETEDSRRMNIWRDYCTDGTPYGLDPNDFDSADDYEDAVKEAKLQNESEQ